MFNLSGSEIVVILLLALVVLGPDKLPDAMRKAGRTFAELKKMASGFQDELRKGFDEPSAELRKTATTIRDAATVTTRAKPSAKMAATTVPEAVAEPAEYPDKPQHNPDVDPTPDLPPGNSVAAPVVAPAATAAAAAGLVGAATDDGTATDDTADAADDDANVTVTVDAADAVDDAMPEPALAAAVDAPSNGESASGEPDDLVDIDDEAAAVGPDLGA